MAIEIYTKQIFSINNEDFQIGDMLMFFRWKDKNDIIREMNEAIIMDITNNSIVVYSNIGGTPQNSIEIKINDIILE